MSVESGTTIAILDSSWPLSGDYITEGDNHIRIIKAVLKATFPGAGATGFSTPITATEAELNYSVGVTSSIQPQLDSLSALSIDYIPAGTIMLFYQAAAPVGWTQIANDDNSLLRMVSGAGAGVGGSDSPISWTSTHVHATTGHALTISEIPAHTHTIKEGTTAPGGSGLTSGDDYTSSVAFSQTSGSAGGGGTHSHGDTDSSGDTFTPRYIDVIQASKD